MEGWAFNYAEVISVMSVISLALPLVDNVESPQKDETLNMCLHEAKRNAWIGNLLVGLRKEHEKLDQHCSQGRLAFSLRRLVDRVRFGIVQACLVRAVE